VYHERERGRKTKGKCEGVKSDRNNGRECKVLYVKNYNGCGKNNYTIMMDTSNITFKHKHKMRTIHVIL
jgi:hypothetical protein